MKMTFRLDLVYERGEFSYATSVVNGDDETIARGASPTSIADAMNLTITDAYRIKGVEQGMAITMLTAMRKQVENVPGTEC